MIPGVSQIVIVVDREGPPSVYDLGKRKANQQGGSAIQTPRSCREGRNWLHDCCYDSARVRYVPKFGQVDTWKPSSVTWRKSWLRVLIRGRGMGGRRTLPCTEVKLSIGNRNRNSRTQERSFRVRDAVVSLRNAIDFASGYNVAAPLTSR